MKNWKTRVVKAIDFTYRSAISLVLVISLVFFGSRVFAYETLFPERSIVKQEKIALYDTGTCPDDFMDITVDAYWTWPQPVQVAGSIALTEVNRDFLWTIGCVDNFATESAQKSLWTGESEYEAVTADYLMSADTGESVVVGRATTWHRATTGEIVESDIRYATDYIDASTLYPVALHETGHALGLNLSLIHI